MRNEELRFSYGIILLVISFSVINYVVSKSVRLRQADVSFFMCLSVRGVRARCPVFRDTLRENAAKTHKVSVIVGHLVHRRRTPATLLHLPAL